MLKCATSLNSSSGTFLIQPRLEGKQSGGIFLSQFSIAVNFISISLGTFVRIFF